jgi:hypothetical protein
MYKSSWRMFLWTKIIHSSKIRNVHYPCRVPFLGFKKPKSTKKDFLDTKGIEIEGEFWIKKPKVNQRVLNLNEVAKFG